MHQTLRDWVAVESDSSDMLKRSDLHQMMDMTAEKLRAMGGKVELVDIGEQEVRRVLLLVLYLCLSRFEQPM